MSFNLIPLRLEIWVVRERLSYLFFIILLNNWVIIDQIHFMFLTDYLCGQPHQKQLKILLLTEGWEHWSATTHEE